MTPEDVAERLREWASDVDCPDWWTRRVECVEPEGPRRTWLLWQDGRQVGHVRMRAPGVGNFVIVPVWTVEASRGIAREAIGLHDEDDAADRG
jgi:hypothetical protein